MIKKSLIHIVTMGFVVIALTACGGSGIDRKLDYSETEKELAESYAKALEEATPDQQNILRERRHIIYSMVYLAKDSDPAIVEANIAKKNADEFKRLSKMSIRELFSWRLGE